MDDRERDCVSYMEGGVGARLGGIQRPGRKVREDLLRRDYIPDTSASPLEELEGQDLETNKHREGRQGPETTANNKKRFKKVHLWNKCGPNNRDKGALDDHGNSNSP